MLGTLSAALLGFLLLRLLFVGRSLSFDTLLYARGLWGLARGDLFNPVLGVSTFAVHAHVLWLPLAPLTYVFPSASVLAVAQAIALGATITLVAREAQRLRAGPAALWFALLITSSPLVLNPFLFDARPDLLGVPFITAALLRAVRQGGFDRRAVLLLCVGALAREDFALVACAALALAPPAVPNLWPLRRRLLGAGAFLAYWGLYFFALRPLLGGSNVSLVMHLSGETPPAFSKLALTGGIATTAGLLPWLGWRWLGAALPGCTVLLLSQWMVEHQLQFHYGMLVAPAFVAAATVGFRSLWTGPRRRRAVWMSVATAVSVAAYVLWSAAPGGRSFAPHNFELATDDGKPRIEQSAATRAVHHALSCIPRTHGVAVPWEFGAPLADRPFIWPLPTLLAHLGRHQRVPRALDTVAVLGDEAFRAARVLVLAHGFKLAGVPQGPVALLTRDKRFQKIPWGFLVNSGEPSCDKPVAAWPDAGLALCGFGTSMGSPEAVVWRREPARSEAARRGVHLIWEGTSSPRRASFWIADGLVNLADLPVGHSVTLIADGTLPDGGKGHPVLLDGRGRPVDPAPTEPRGLPEIAP